MIIASIISIMIFIVVIIIIVTIIIRSNIIIIITFILIVIIAVLLVVIIIILFLMNMVKARKPESLAQEVTLHKVQVQLEMTVDDPQTIIENATLVNAMRRGMANLLNVSEDAVTVIFETSRRLQSSNSTTLNVLFEVTFNDAAAAEVPPG
eukprot:s3273_g2.t1